jgi:hypothetical protein
VLARRGLDHLSREDLNNLLRQQWQRLIRKCSSPPQQPSQRNPGRQRD